MLRDMSKIMTKSMTAGDILAIINNFENAVTAPYPQHPEHYTSQYDPLVVEYRRLEKDRRDLIIATGKQMERAYFEAMRRSILTPHVDANWAAIAANILAGLDRWVGQE